MIPLIKDSFNVNHYILMDIITLFETDWHLLYKFWKFCIDNYHLTCMHGTFLE